MATLLEHRPQAPTGAKEIAKHGRPRRRKRDLSIRIAIVISVVFVLLGSVYPTGAVLSVALSAEALPRYAEFLTSSVDLGILRNTLVLGLLVGLVGTAIGFLFAFVQTRLDVPFKRLFHVMALVPIVSPPFAVATAAIVLYGRRGAISYGLFGIEYDIYGLDGLVLVLSLSLFPVAYLGLVAMMRGARPGDGGVRDDHGGVGRADLPDGDAAIARSRARRPVPAAFRGGDRRSGQSADVGR